MKMDFLHINDQCSLFYPIYLEDYNFKNLFLVIIENKENDEHVKIVEETIMTAYIFKDMLVLKLVPNVFKEPDTTDFISTVDLTKETFKNSRNVIFNKLDRSGNIIETKALNNCVLYDMTEDVYDYSINPKHIEDEFIYKPILEISVILKFTNE